MGVVEKFNIFQIFAILHKLTLIYMRYNYEVGDKLTIT